MLKFVKILLLASAAIIILTAILLGYFFVGEAPAQKNGITWGVDFSQMQAESLGLDWKETYLALLDDLKFKNLKLHTQWDWVEGKENEHHFSDIDWQISEAEKRNVKIIYVLGLKTGRWPECHMPDWAGKIPKNGQQAEVLDYIKAVVLRYKSSGSVIAWQVENEPFFRFGECPEWYYESDKFIKEEVNLVKNQDQTRPVIITDSGEQSAWFEAAKIGDIVGITLYRSAWAPVTDTFGFRVYSFLNPVTYFKKAEIIRKVFSKKVIGIELQAEPWASTPFNASVKEQEESMNLEIFRENIEFARQTGLDTFYFWGAEWWYWMKEKQNRPEIWNEAKNLFSN